MDREKDGKYLFVDCSEMQKRLFVRIPKKGIFSIGENKYELLENEPVASFEKFEIPSEFRKFIICKRYPKMGVEASDFTTGKAFNISGYNNFKKVMTSITGATYFDDKHNYFNFNTPYIIRTYDEVIDFYKSLKENGLYDRYIMTMGSFFDTDYVRFNLDDLVESEMKLTMKKGK